MTNLHFEDSEQSSACADMLEGPVSPSRPPLMAHEVLQRLRSHRATRQKLRGDLKSPSDSQLLAAAFRGCDLVYSASASPPVVPLPSPSGSI